MKRLREWWRKVRKAFDDDINIYIEAMIRGDESPTIKSDLKEISGCLRRLI